AEEDTSAFTIRVVTRVGDLTSAVAEHTRPENAASWDPVGLQLGDLDASVEKVGVCHEVNEEVVESLERQPVDLLVTYHPLLFEPTNQLLAGRSAEARAFRLVSMGVNLLVTHTDFDAAPGGTADALASTLKLREPEPFGGDNPEGTPDIGRVGDFDATLAVLDALVSDAFGPNGLRITGNRHAQVDRVAVVPGSGSDFIAAAAERADALVTGDVPHHRAVRAADLGLAIVDPGHTATERPGMRALVDLIITVSDVEVVDLTAFDPQTWT
ncbi:MAG: Nif3-like dinuclear metal center hexameric protein, partial [Actinobacteria bacterium]|nr:Nif3-like dinuclear metal center hexameric protein [Actinomycetota bacterium]